MSETTAPTAGAARRLAFADLHNHSLHSDGHGDPETAFASMRAAGLQVAALTDHAAIPRPLLDRLDPAWYPDEAAQSLAQVYTPSLTDETWWRTAEIADIYDVPGEFTALRGFEWTEQWLGHVNVWFSEEFTPVTTPGSMAGLFDFVAGEPAALFGYNHPGREPGAFHDFALPTGPRHRALTERLVTLEVFNRYDDYLFAGSNPNVPSALVRCLDAGWRPALTGASDEHGRSYGLAGKGRTGLWLHELSRPGVRAALLERRAYATREVGLQVAASLGGVPMGGELGGELGSPSGPLALEVTVAGGGRDGQEFELQLLTSGDPVTVVAAVPGQVGEPLRAEVSVPDGARWLVARVADRSRSYGRSAPAGHPCACWALAYASPWFLAHDARPGGTP